jgi:hypothetical protein
MEARVPALMKSQRQQNTQVKRVVLGSGSVGHQLIWSFNKFPGDEKERMCKYTKRIESHTHPELDLKMATVEMGSPPNIFLRPLSSQHLDLL